MAVRPGTDAHTSPEAIGVSILKSVRIVSCCCEGEVL